MIKSENQTLSMAEEKTNSKNEEKIANIKEEDTRIEIKHESISFSR